MARNSHPRCRWNLFRRKTQLVNWIRRNANGPDTTTTNVEKKKARKKLPQTPNDGISKDGWSATSVVDIDASIDPYHTHDSNSNNKNEKGHEGSTVGDENNTTSDFAAAEVRYIQSTLSTRGGASIVTTDEELAEWSLETSQMLVADSTSSWRPIQHCDLDSYHAPNSNWRLSKHFEDIGCIPVCVKRLPNHQILLEPLVDDPVNVTIITANDDSTNDNEERYSELGGQSQENAVHDDDDDEVYFDKEDESSTTENSSGWGTPKNGVDAIFRPRTCPSFDYDNNNDDDQQLHQQFGFPRELPKCDRSGMNHTVHWLAEV